MRINKWNVPRKDGDQDSLEEILTLSPEEKGYWSKMELSENSFMKDLGILDTI